MIKVAGWKIEHNPKPIPTDKYDWDFYHDEYYADCDSDNGLSGTAMSEVEALMQIIEIEQSLRLESDAPRQTSYFYHYSLLAPLPNGANYKAGTFMVKNKITGPEMYTETINEIAKGRGFGENREAFTVLSLSLLHGTD